MGSGRFSAEDYSTYSSSVKHKTVDEVFQTHTRTRGKEVDDELNPYGVKIRESRDSVDNPLSNAIAISLDVTSSMDNISDYFVKEGLGVVFTEILKRKPVSDPHLMVMAHDDVETGVMWPFQASQFEADNRIVQQTSRIYLTRNGGGNGSESYQIPWYFAGVHTSIDCMEKRNRKGYLFTIGDDGVPPYELTPQHIEKILGYKPEKGFTTQECLALASRMYNVFHIMIEQGSTHSPRVVEAWRKILGERALLLSDYKSLGELIVSTIQVLEGSTVEEVSNSWNGGTAVVVRKALGGLVKSGSGSTGLTSL